MSIGWPSLLVGVLIAAYWARVLRMALRSRRRAGHGANLLPPEPLGRILRFFWFPTVGLWIALPLIAALTTHHRQGFHIVAPWPIPMTAQWLAVGVAVIAFIGTLICWRRMGRSWRMGIDPGDTTRLIITGPFAYVRHPIYMLSSVLMLCAVAVAPSILMFIVAAVHIGLLNWEARREEKYLLKLHGVLYAGYMAHTGRFLPRSFQAYVIDAPATASFDSSTVTLH